MKGTYLGEFEEIVLLAVGCWQGSLAQGSAPAQTPYRVAFSGKKLVLHPEGSNWVVEGHEGNQVILEAQTGRKASKDARELTALTAGLADNTGLGVHAALAGAVLTLTSVSADPSMSYHLKIPNLLAVSILETGHEDPKHWTIRNLKGELEIQTREALIDLEDITGPALVYAEDGHIRARFRALYQQKPTSLSVGDGDITIELPKGTPCKLKTRHLDEGHTYAEFELSPTSKPPPSAVGERIIEGTLNGGGVAVELTVGSGNIYLKQVASPKQTTSYQSAAKPAQ